MPRPTGKDYSLKGLLSQRNIEIPEYQRTYDWSKSTVEQLLDCLSEHQELYKGTLQSNPYFLGNLMIHSISGEDEGKLYLVDGQQRMVTLTILAGLIRDLLCDNECYEKAFDLQETIIGDINAESPLLRPRDTKTESSPKELLWPIQAPKDQKIEFYFTEEYSDSKALSQFNLSEDLVTKFPLKANTIHELNVGVKFEVIAEISAGQTIGNLYGNLILDEGASIKPEDKLVIHSKSRSVVISERMAQTWNKSRLIPQHFNKNMRNYILAAMDESNQNPEEFLTDWKDIITYMAFTSTKFTAEDDAIYYFGKLNDADTSQQLNVGDLMRHHAAFVVKRPPLDHDRDDEIKTHWDEVEKLLKEEKDKDMVPAFLSSMLTAQGNRHTERKAYGALKLQSKDLYETGGTWDKEGFYSWMNNIRKGAKEFRKIAFPLIGDSNHLSMKCINGLAKQHRPLFLAGLLGFERHGLNNEMRRLINIFEFMTMKGVELPTLCNINGITSQDRYALVDKYCNKIYQKSNKFETKMIPSVAKTILAEFADDVKGRCDGIWIGAAADPALPNISGWDTSSLASLEFNQSQSKMILSRIEIESTVGSKTWADDVEVEHIAPQTWQDEWADKTKGGGFSDAEELAIYLNRIGNRTLLNPGSNSTLSNACLHDKQSNEQCGYDKQANSWVVTKDLISTKVTVWSPENVEKRSEKLITKLLEIYDGDFLD